MSSGFITKVLSPLMTSSSATSSSTEKPLSLVEIDEILKTLLSQIDQRPLQFTERNNIQREIAKFMKINNIQPNSLHIQELSSRLSYTFFPSVSPSTNTSTTTKKIKSIQENNTITKPTPSKYYMIIVIIIVK